MYHILDEFDELHLQALTLSKVIARILEQKANIKLSRKPIFILKPITEFMKRMRASGLTKFPEKTYISTINFYKSMADLERHRALGALIIYIGESYIPDLIHKLDYPDIDEDNEEDLEDACGTFCNLIAGNFKSALNQLGYQELVMSHFSGYQNSVLEGVEFSPDQTQMYELQFDIKGEKRIVAELSMGDIPKK